MDKHDLSLHFEAENDHYRHTADLVRTLRARSLGNDKRWDELERLALQRSWRSPTTLYFYGTARTGTRTMLYSLFIQLWGAAGHHPDYRKEDWLELQTLIFGALNGHRD